MNKITFTKVTSLHKEIIFNWLDKPHVKKYWDNSLEHREDIITFIDGRKTPSNYFNGIMQYWVGHMEDQPYCFLLTSVYSTEEDLPDLHLKHLSSEGATYGIDFCIGDENLLGKGYAAPTLETFVKFYKDNIDPNVYSFFIDPDEKNLKAIHVYEKAGFQKVGIFFFKEGFFSGHNSVFMIKQV